MATNRLYAGNNTTLPNQDVTPGAGKMGGAAVSGDPVVVGSIPGVMLGNAGTDGTGIIQRDGVFNLSVKGIGNSGSAAVNEGDIVYFTAADTPPLSGKSTSAVRFGYALKGVASGATATIPVQVGY